MFNPMMLGLSMLTGANNPQAMAQALAATGQKPGEADGMLNMGTGLGQFLAPQAGTPGGIVPAAVTPPGGLPGFKAPEPVKPVFNAGVSGAQDAPKVQAGGRNLATAEILQALLGSGGDPLRVQGLGDLLRPVR